MGNLNKSTVEYKKHFEELKVNYSSELNVFQYLKIIDKLKEIDEIEYYDVVLEDEWIYFYINKNNVVIVYEIYKDITAEDNPFEDIMFRLDDIKQSTNVNAYRSEYMVEEDLEKDWYIDNIHWRLIHNEYNN